MSAERGRCLCGAVRYEFTGEANWRAHCHCESCRRNCAAPFTTFFGVPVGAFRHTGEAPKVYASSPGVRRSFCGTCGTPMAYESDDYPDEIHLYAASLEDARDFAPQRHVFYEEKLPWIHLADDLPRHPRNSGG